MTATQRDILAKLSDGWTLEDGEEMVTKWDHARRARIYKGHLSASVRPTTVDAMLAAGLIVCDHFSHPYSYYKPVTV